jgi:hypothetical protein
MVRRIAARLMFFALSWAAVGCGSRRQEGPRGVLAAPAPGPVVARLGGEPILASELEAFAIRERIADSREALRRYLDERLLAAESLRRGGANASEVGEVARRASIQRLLQLTVERSRTELNIPPSLLEHLRRTRGFALSHGPLHNVVHAVVRLPPDASAAAVGAARARAEAIRAGILAVASQRDLDQLRRVADGVTGREEVRVEQVRGFDERGGTGTSSGIDPIFSATAAALSRENEVSEVVRTPFGFHVLVLRGREPALLADRAAVERTVVHEALALWRAQELQRMLGSMRARANLRFEEGTGASP